MPGGLAGAAAAYKAAAKAGECSPLRRAISPLASAGSPLGKEPFLRGKQTGASAPSPGGVGRQPAVPESQRWWQTQTSAPGPPACDCSWCDLSPLPLLAL